MSVGLVIPTPSPAAALGGLRQALAFDRWMAENPGADHHALEQARALLLAGEPLCEVSERDLDRALERIAAIETPDDLPVAPELMRLMVDALVFRHGLGSRARAWSLVGVSPAHGRRHIAGEYQSWPLWSTLREHAVSAAEPPARVIAWARS